MAASALGERIAVYRRRRGLSQAALAGMVGRSESWLSQVERGIRSVDRLSVLLDMARVLHVDVGSLAGRPWQYAPNGGPVAGGLEDVRKVFSRYNHLLGEEVTPALDLRELRTSIATAHGTYQAARYSDVITQLPQLLVAVDSIRTPGSEDRRETFVTYVTAYVVAAKLMTKLGETDLALLAADRAATVAVEADSLAARGMAAYQVVCALLRADRSDHAEHVAVRMAQEVEARANSDSPTLVSIAGSLWLIGAIVAARRTDRSEAWQRLDRADILARLLGEDANHAWTAFGPTNVAIHRVAVAAELGDAGEAVHAAADVEPDTLPEGLSSRRAQVNLDLAWAHAQRKRDAEATIHLLEAERVAPEALRYNVIARELTREMLARSRSKTSVLHDLAVRSGVLE